jgi:capsular polysaccharide biosynthesis protein
VSGPFGESPERRGGTRYIRSLRQHWPFIALTVMAALLTAFAYTSLAEKRYEAAADILVSPVSNDDAAFTGLPVIRESVESRSVVTVARMLRSPQVADEVRLRLGLEIDRKTLIERVEVRPQEQSNIVTVVAAGETPAEAARIANAFAETLLAQRKSQFNRALRGVLARLSSPGQTGEQASERIATLRSLLGEGDPTLSISSHAVAPVDPSWPRPALSFTVALLAGILLGMAIAVGLEILSPLILQESELTTYGASVLARAPRVSRRQLRELIAHGRLPSEVVDSYRLVSVQVARGGSLSPRSLLVTSPSSSLDRAMVTLLLAHVSGAGQAVLVDADVRRSSLRSILSQPGSSATADRPRGRQPATGSDRIQLLPESEFGSAAERGEGWAERLLEKLRSGNDLVLVDAPSPSESAEAFEFATSVERALVVVRLGRTRQDLLDELMRTLANAGVTASFVVVSRRTARGRSESTEGAARPTLAASS